MHRVTHFFGYLSETYGFRDVHGSASSATPQSGGTRDEAAKILSGSEGATHKHGIRACSAYGGGKRHEQLKNLQWGARWALSGDQ